jgi:hypothetical protein
MVILSIALAATAVIGYLGWQALAHPAAQSLPSSGHFGVLTGVTVTIYMGTVIAPSSAGGGWFTNWSGVVAGGTGPYTYSWTSSEGGSGSASTWAHTFTTGGSIWVSLKGCDHDNVCTTGTVDGTESICISPDGVPCGAYWPCHFQHTLPCPMGVGSTFVQGTVTAFGSSPFTFSTSWGDGTGPTTGTTPAHTYSTHQANTITTTATDSLGGMRSTNFAWQS